MYYCAYNIFRWNIYNKSQHKEGERELSYTGVIFLYVIVIKLVYIEVNSNNLFMVSSRPVTKKIKVF